MTYLDARQADSCCQSAAGDAAEDSAGSSRASCTAVAPVHQQRPTCLTDMSAPQLEMLSPTHRSAASASHSAYSDNAAHMLSTPSSYRASFDRLQPVHMPDVDRCRHGNVTSHSAVTDSRRRFVVPS